MRAVHAACDTCPTVLGSVGADPLKGVEKPWPVPGLLDLSSSMIFLFSSTNQLESTWGAGQLKVLHRLVQVQRDRW